MNSPKTAGYTLLALSCCLPLSVQAEKIAEEVVVTANRVERPLSTIPNTITIINEAELAQQLAVNNDISTVLGN